MLHAIWNVIVLPREISAFERNYLKRVNRLTMRFFILHIPVFGLVAWFNKTSPLLALILTSGVAVGPVLAYRLFENPRHVGLVYGFTAMLMGGLLVHFGQGPVQIEMHFYFFALIAMLAVFGNPLAILVAAVTVALHHLLLWLLLPASVFNYDAPGWVVAVHAAFVVLESVATVYIARSFFNNVIGLERVVQSRTLELDDKNRAMRLVLDNVEQGLLIVDLDGRIQPEYSASVPRWLGTPEPGQRFADFLRDLDETFALQFAMAWEQCREDLLPLELSVSQAPARLYHDGQQLLFSYRPVLKDNGELAGLLVVIADVSADVERQRLELEQKETLGLLDRVINDRQGFIEFFNEGCELVSAIGRATARDLQKRGLHTLKGNCLVFGVQTVADVCHELEETGALLDQGQTARLTKLWESLQRRSNKLLGERGQVHLEIESAQFDHLLRAVLEARPHGEIAQMVAQLKLEPLAARFSRVAAQARRLATRLNKEGVEVEVDDGMLRLDPRSWGAFWSAFIHVVRNAVDHGLETADVRGNAGKAGSGRLQLRSSLEGDDFVITLSDDGRGIDWERVRERARELGLAHATDDDLKQALFADGLSTAGVVTEVSGRGVGLAAVRAACEARGGHVEVQSTPGYGTTFSFRFPRATITVKPEDLLRPSSYRPRARFSSRAPAIVELGNRTQ